MTTLKPTRIIAALGLNGAPCALLIRVFSPCSSSRVIAVKSVLSLLYVQRSWPREQ